MKRSITLALALCIVTAAYATPPGNNGGGNGGCGQGQQTNGCGTPVTGGAGGDATALAAQAQGQMQGQAQQALGGNAQSISGGNLITVSGDHTESNTPPVVAGPIPAVPTSCRLYLFGGGATRDGAASGSIPLGNDETCLSIAKLNLMERAGGFTQREKQSVACKVEGMGELKTCRDLATLPK